MGIKHLFVSPKEDGADETLVRPSNWNAEHVLRWTLNKLLKGGGPDADPTEIDPYTHPTTGSCPQTPKAHTLASHSTKAHTELTDVTADQHHTKYTDAEAKAAAVKAGAITNGETKAPTHDAVYDVKQTADIATTPAEVDAKILTHKNIAAAHHAKTTSASELTSGVLPSIDRLPALTTNKMWKGVSNRPTEVDVPGGVPSGVIVMWHGLISNIPAGWVICDGNNNTPNLLAKFVQGVATAGTNPGATGGEAAHVLTVAEMPSHKHDLSVYNGEGLEGYARSGDDGYAERTASTGYTGSGNAHQNKPPYYDVAFIMKT